MAIPSLTPSAPEEGVYVITIAWEDEDGAAVTPDSATWTLTDNRGNVINSRSAVTISSLSTSNDIILEGDDLALTGTGVQREIRFSYTYTSDLGELSDEEVARFSIDDAWSL